MEVSGVMSCSITMLVSELPAIVRDESEYGMENRLRKSVECVDDCS